MNKEHVGGQNDKTPPVYNVMEGVKQKTDSDGRMSCEGGKKGIIKRKGITDIRSCCSLDFMGTEMFHYVSGASLLTA